MNRRDIVIGAIVVAVFGGFLIFRSRNQETPTVPEATPTPTPSSQASLEQTLGKTLSQTAEKIDLKDDTESGYSAIVAREEKDGEVNLSVLADLDILETGAYQVWAGPDPNSLVSLGTLSEHKGGYIFEYQKAGKLSDYKSIVISKELKVDDTMEQQIMTGSF